MKKKIIALLVIVVVVFTLFVGKGILKEKYCYNSAFMSLEQSGIKLGEVEKVLRDHGYSPLQAGSTPGYKEWWSAYTKCYNTFDLSRINFSILVKSYPDYKHFID